jgi:hypothetical protein
MKRNTGKVPPKPVSPPEGNYSINEAYRMVGKTVASVDVGHQKRTPKVHQSELIVIHFTDGTALAIDTGSNAWNLLDNPDEFHADFMLEWFP